MDSPEKESSYLLREEFLEPDSDDDFTYEEVAIDDADASSGDEDLSTAFRNNAHILPSVPVKSSDLKVVKDVPLTATPSPEVVEDFVCNFLASNNMHATLDSFQSEWYRLATNNQLQVHQAMVLPDAYAQIRQLETALSQLKLELQGYKRSAKHSKELLLRVQKERDYHRMHHRRVVQEKDRLITDLKRVKDHYSDYEPLMQALQQKYQVVSKERMLACLERDRVKYEVNCLQSTLQSVQQATGPSTVPSIPLSDDTLEPFVCLKSKLILNLPPEPAHHTYHDTDQLPVCTHLTRTGGFQPSRSVQAHSHAATALDVHPSKPVVATASDDHTWKLWTISSGELLMCGEGHSDWLSTVHFHPEATSLATGSGDGSIKIWDLKDASCIQTLSDHQQPIWGVAWHWAGSVLASASMDHTVKIWDPVARVCLSTLRGHGDSVNGAAFLPFSNTLATCSADKSISLWDIRTGLCIHSFYGHQHACSCLCPTFQGQEVFSGDCLGNIFSWDIRAQSCRCKWSLGHEAINDIAVDSGRTLCACATDGQDITLLDPASHKEWKLEGRSDRVLAVAFTSEADGLISTACGGSFTVWQ